MVIHQLVTEELKFGKNTNYTIKLPLGLDGLHYQLATSSIVMAGTSVK